jgi:hypothetical protein
MLAIESFRARRYSQGKERMKLVLKPGDLRGLCVALIVVFLLAVLVRLLQYYIKTRSML